MKINRNNYEEYFIDYFEGNLNREEKDALFVFLSHNPDLKTEFEEFENIEITVPQVEYKFKNELKKRTGDLDRVNDNNIDEYSIAYLENDLNEDEKNWLSEALENNEDYKKTFNLYQKTKLFPSTNVIFSQKKLLKHFVIERKWVLRIAGYAAAAIIVLGLFLIKPEKQAVTIQEHTAELVNTKENTNVNAIVKENIKTQSKNQVQVKKTVKYNVLKSDEKTEGKTIVEPVNDLKKLETKTLIELENKLTASIVITEKPEVHADTVEQPVQKIAETEQPATDHLTIDRKLDLRTVAELGLKVFNKLNESSYNIKASYNTEGRIKSVTFMSEQRKITTPAI